MKTSDRNAILHGIQVLDGGMASELEYQGANINGPLWSAHVLQDSPEKIIAGEASQTVSEILVNSDHSIKWVG